MTSRRGFAIMLVVALAVAASTACDPPPSVVPRGLTGAAALEARIGGRIGLLAVDTGSGAVVSHRGQETFPMCSTAKALLAGLVLRRADDDAALLDRHVRWTPGQLVKASPDTTARLATGASVAELAAAAIEDSDNTASNLLNGQVGGPAATTAFLRRLGDPVTRLDHLEPMPAAVSPGDDRDSTTPQWFAQDLRNLVLGTELSAAGRDRLEGWMRAATTGRDQIRAGVPGGWIVGDKTGQCSGRFVNDVAVLRPPDRAPIVLVVFVALADAARVRDGIATIAAASAAALHDLGDGR